MNTAIVIPARMGSSRFPGKPLVPLLGRPMIEHVYRRAALWRGSGTVWVATCDDEIRVAVESIGGQVIMTSPTHERASDRVAEAAAGLRVDAVVMVQGDEPMITPDSIESAVSALEASPEIGCVNLLRRIESEDELRDRNTIKVVADKNLNALFFSREPIPTTEVLGFPAIRAFKQVCVISFRQSALRLYSKLPPTPLERTESIDMMRFLEHGHTVRLVETDLVTHAVDTPTDLERVAEMMREDPLTMRTIPQGA